VVLGSGFKVPGSEPQNQEPGTWNHLTE